jgi:hypothetical protein
MSLSHSPQIVRNGLILCVDPDNIRSYSGSGISILNLVDGTSQTLNGTFSKPSLGIRLTNDNISGSSNISRLNINSYASIRTISVWVNIVNNITGNYIFDARNGAGADGYVWNGGIGSFWSGLSVNGQNKTTPTIGDSFSTGSWRFLTYESSASFTDNVTMFSRFSNIEGLNCTFGQILFYNRVLTNEEINKNFNALKGRYSL